MAKFEIRASVNMTVDFDITAEDETSAERKVENYLKYVSGGKLDNQVISVKTEKDDLLTHLFVMECEIEDCNEL